MEDVQLNNATRHLDSPRLRGWRTWSLTALGIAALVCIAHGGSLQNGLWLDDHAHFQNLRRSDWSFSSAVRASRLEIVGEVMELWGQRREALWFFRPVAFWLMKLSYTLTGWQPAPMHAFSLLWHFGCAMLVGRLAARVLGGQRWGILAAMATAAHPGHCITVNWVACQTELMATFFLLAGTLSYARHAGWRHPVLSIRPMECESPAATRNEQTPSRITLAGLLAVACYAAALGCRENAVLFPVVCWLGDWAFRTRRRGWLRWEHLAMVAVLLGYFGLRWLSLGGFSLPSRPYAMTPADAGFLTFLSNKLVYYVAGMTRLVPVLPNGMHDFVSTHSSLAYAGFAVNVAALLLIWRACQWTRTILWPLAWFFCFVAPVLPVFASGHHLYLPAPGVVLLMIAGLAAIAANHRPATGPRSRFRIGLAAGLVVFYSIAMTGMSVLSGRLFRSGTEREDQFIAQVLDSGAELHEGDRLFFINLAYPCYYAVTAIENQTGLGELHGAALTFATDSFDAGPPAEITLLDHRRLSVRSHGDELYLGGKLGKTLLAMMGFDHMPGEGSSINSGEFTVTPISADEAGIREVVFTFREPMDSPRYHFFAGSPERITAPLDVSRPHPKPQNGNHMTRFAR